MKINYKKEFVKNKQGYLKYLDLNKVKTRIMNGSKEGRRFLKTMVMTSWLTSTIVDIMKKEKSS